MLEGAPGEVIPEADLPFTRLKLVDDEEEDVLEAVQLGMTLLLSCVRNKFMFIFCSEKVWVVDIPHPRHTTIMLK